MRPPILLITVDDLSADSLGAYGCPVAETSPHLDRFAEQARVFRHAHVQVGNCMPSRNVMMSGLYPFQNGVEGFRPVEPAKAKTLVEDLRQAGYFTAIRGKAQHTTPFHPFPAWNLIDDRPSDPDAAPLEPVDQKARDAKGPDKKDPASYGRSLAIAAAAARAAGQPLFLNLNISDPHKPFYSGPDDPNQPSRVFTADDIVVPGFLVPLKEDAAVREEVAAYYSSVRRADDAFGEILAAAAEAGLDDAVVIFLSDHGMPLPFAKTQLYHHSTRTPLMVRGPGIVAGQDDTHVVSAVDLTPTVLDLLGIDPGREFAGRSFAPLLAGGRQDGREFAVMTYFENSGRNRHPMRTIRTRDLGYLFNPWSDGVEDFATATDGTVSYKRLVAAAATDPLAQSRLDLMDHRVREELYDYAADPDALTNLIDARRDDAERLRGLLLDWMAEHGDPMRSVLAARTDEAVAEYMRKQKELEAEIKRKQPRRKAPKQRKILRLDPDDVVTGMVAGDAVVQVGLAYRKAPKSTLVVTLKTADGRRLDRRTAAIAGTGQTTVEFADPGLGQVRVSAFVSPTGEYADAVQHLTTEPVTLER